MVVKLFESTYDNIKDRLKNPFFGTLLLVWIIRNREFLFNLIFNERINSDERLLILSNQFNGWFPILNFLYSILISLLLLAVFYSALNLSRYIVQFSEKIIQPKILELFSKSSIVTREVYEQLEVDRDYYNKKYNDERKERLSFQKELDVKQVLPENKFDSGNTDEEKSFYQKITKSIIDNDYQEEFEKLIGLINSDFDVSGIEPEIKKNIVDFFLGKNIIKAVYKNNQYYYAFTDFGNSVRDYFLRTYI